MNDRAARRIVAVEAAVLLLFLVVSLAIGDYALSVAIGIVVVIALASFIDYGDL